MSFEDGSWFQRAVMWPSLLFPDAQWANSPHDFRPVTLRNSASSSSGLGTHPGGFWAIMDHVSLVDGMSLLRAR
jgi:hypothetical protein